jgi:hypothetical protein
MKSIIRAQDATTSYFAFWFKSLILSAQTSLKEKHRLLATLLTVPTVAFFSATAMAAIYANQTELEAAISAVAVMGGGTVDIEDSNIVLTSTLEIPAGVTLTSSTNNGILEAASPPPPPSYASITPTTPLAMGRTYNPMIHVTGDGVTISNITIIGGPGTFPGSFNVDGIYAEGDVIIDSVTIQDIVDVKGTGTAIAIIDPANATITNCSITNITKNSIDFLSDGVLIATNNTITGPGADPTVAQNGIQVRGGTATLTDNTISHIADTNIYGSACVAAIGGTVTVNGGSLTGCDYGVLSDGSFSALMGGTASPAVTILSNTTISGNNIQNINQTNGGTITMRAVSTSVPTTSGGILAVIGLLLAGLATVTLRRRRIS